jgi:hypothetical protein
MRGVLRTAGEVLRIDSQVGWLNRILHEGSAGALDESSTAEPTVCVKVEQSRRAFDVERWSPLDRGAWTYRGSVVIRDACTSGFDVRISIADDRPLFTFRWRPPPRTHVANRILQSRFHLLTRAALLQYPALWWSSVRGRVPLHASVLTAGRATPVIVGASGSGKSTLIAAELAAGGSATCDNVCSSDGVGTWGLVEPLRLDAGGSGRRMPHGRREAALDRRVNGLVPDRLVVLRRGPGPQPNISPTTPEAATRQLVTGTYMAGELRRYWGFAATLASGTGVGPAHPDIQGAAEQLAERLECFELMLSTCHGARLAELLDREETPQWA